MEGYGQTECTAAASVALVGDHESGHVGPPLACNYIKLMDVKDMNYFAENNEGEVCLLLSSSSPLLSFAVFLLPSPFFCCLPPPLSFQLPSFPSRSVSRATISSKAITTTRRRQLRSLMQMAGFIRET